MEDAIAQVAKFEAEEAARQAKRQCSETVAATAEDRPADEKQEDSKEEVHEDEEEEDDEENDEEEKEEMEDDDANEESQVEEYDEKKVERYEDIKEDEAEERKATEEDKTRNNEHVKETPAPQADDVASVSESAKDSVNNDKAEVAAQVAAPAKVVQLPSAAAKDLWKRRAKVFQDKIKMVAAGDNMWSLLPDIPESTPVGSIAISAASVSDGGDGSTRDDSNIPNTQDTLNASDEAKPEDKEPAAQHVEKPIEMGAETVDAKVSAEGRDRKASAAAKTNLAEGNGGKTVQPDMWGGLPDM